MSQEELKQLKEDLHTVFDSVGIGEYKIEIRGRSFLVKIPMARYVPRVAIQQIESLGYSFMTFQGMIESEKTFLGITIGGKKNES